MDFGFGQLLFDYVLETETETEMMRKTENVSLDQTESANHSAGAALLSINKSETGSSVN